MDLNNILANHLLWLQSFGENGEMADLRGADLYVANLYGADLRRANLRGANLYGADLRGANLYGADLREADLRRANLYGADLREANLYGADIHRANLHEANLYGAKSIYAFGPMPTSGRTIYAIRHETGFVVRAGCFWGDLAALKTAVENSHKCPVYLGVIELLQKI